MEGLRVAAGAQTRCLENSVVKAGASIAAHACDSQDPSKSAAECGAISFSKQKVYETVAFGGDGVSGVRRRRGRRMSLPMLARRSSTPAPRARSLHTESPLININSLDLEAEAPSLLQQCSDLDWKKLVSDMRSEALGGFQSADLRPLSLQALDMRMISWMREQITGEIENSTLRHIPTDPGWSFEAAATDLRIEANLQAAQALAQEVDSNFDWENDVAELHQRILLHGDAQPSVSMPEKQGMWQAWTRARRYSFESCEQLAQEVMGSTSMNEFGMVPETERHVHVVSPANDSSINGVSTRKSFLGLGAAIVAGLAAAEGIWLQSAVAAGIAMDAPSTVEPSSRAPSWIVPAVLLFPPLSYFLFSYYRDNVNPAAKLTDWMFGVVAIVIVSNVVMIAVWGVRLY